jgi:hypothetical protein
VSRSGVASMLAVFIAALLEERRACALLHVDDDDHAPTAGPVDGSPTASSGRSWVALLAGAVTLGGVWLVEGPGGWMHGGMLGAAAMICALAVVNLHAVARSVPLQAPTLQEAGDRGGDEAVWQLQMGVCALGMVVLHGASTFSNSYLDYELLCLRFLTGSAVGGTLLRRALTCSVTASAEDDAGSQPPRAWHTHGRPRVVLLALALMLCLRFCEVVMMHAEHEKMVIVAEVEAHAWERIADEHSQTLRWLVAGLGGLGCAALRERERMGYWQRAPGQSPAGTASVDGGGQGFAGKVQTVVWGLAMLGVVATTLHWVEAHSEARKSAPARTQTCLAQVLFGHCSIPCHRLDR